MGEISAGVQKTYNDRDLVNPNGTRSQSDASPLIYNATASVFPTDDIAMFASYTRGLEDGGVAPDRAANPGEAAPASITRQADVGVRYAITPRLKLIAGAFLIKKPLFDLDARNIFTQVGDISHKGLEFSVTGSVTDHLTVVAGVVLLRARVSGDLVDRGVIGPIPPERSPVVGRLNLQYTLPTWPSLILDAQAQHDAGQYGDVSDIFRTNSLTSFDLGARYRFKIGGAPATLRGQVLNVTNAFEWQVGPGRAL